MPTTDFTPVSGFDLPRFAGLPTFMRLPHVPLDDPRIGEVEIGLVGAAWDSGTTNRAGARHGPRQLRDLSTMIRAEHGATGVRPFERRRCADLGDVSPNPVDVRDGLERMRAFYARVKGAGIRPLTAGGFAEATGIRVVAIEEFFARGVADVMAEARDRAGGGRTYVSYDIDFVDPTFAPGTGTPEVGGPSSFQALQVVRGLQGVDIAGADVVEVSPPFDPSGGTAWLAASVMFELLCVAI